MGWDGKERRSSKRYGIKNSTVVYRKGGLLAVFKPPSSTYLLLNLGFGGCHFITKEALPEGQALWVTIDAVQVRGTIRARGRVIWTRRSEEHDAWHVGVAFGRPSSGANARLKNLLDGAILENIEISTRAYMKQIEKL